ncbi:MAG TPA: LysM peptidoglycan-binding domain-containing protein [archaeon]|nr:LysM peptidoglycan-binding domain-containing protein [archaeon]
MSGRVSLIFILGLGFLGFAACGRQKPADLRGELAQLAGRMAREDDLRGVRFEDLNGDGAREVILVFGPRELLDFDVYYRDKGGDWSLTPMVNDQNNPREFIGTRLDSIRDINGDGVQEIRVSSRLYDGNTMVKEVHWSPTGYQVISQRTELAQMERIKPVTPRTVQSAQAQSSSAQPETQKPAQAVEKKEQPKPKPVPPIQPSTGTYLVKKGDTAYGIADALGASLDELESLNENQLSRRGLRIGQKINVPVPRARREHLTVRIEKESYTVQPGDNLISIARKYGTSVQALKSWNSSIPEDGSINVGQRLSIHLAVVDIKS